MPPRPPGPAVRSSSHSRAASTARLRKGRGEKRSQILSPSSTAMKNDFQKRPRQENGSGTRGKRRLVCSRPSGHSSSSVRRRGSHFTGLRSMMISSGPITHRDQYETSLMLKRKNGGGREHGLRRRGRPAGP